MTKSKELKALVTKTEVELAKIMTEKETAPQAGDDKLVKIALLFPLNRAEVQLCQRSYCRLRSLTSGSC